MWKMFLNNFIIHIKKSTCMKFSKKSSISRFFPKHANFFAKEAYLNSDLNLLQISAHEEQITATYYNRKPRTNIQITFKKVLFFAFFSLDIQPFLYSAQFKSQTKIYMQHSKYHNKFTRIQKQKKVCSKITSACYFLLEKFRRWRVWMKRTISF